MKLFGLKDENGREYELNVIGNRFYIDGEIITQIKPINAEPTPKFKVGDWIIRKDGNIPKRIKYVDKYAFLCDDEISDHLFENADGYCAYRFATQSEIESHLIKIAEKKGFKNGVMFTGLRFHRDCKMLWQVGSTDVEQFKGYYKDGDYLIVEDVKNGVWELIYQQGKWATIIPDKKPLPKTKEEFMNFLGTYCNRHCKSVQEFLDDYED